MGDRTSVMILIGGALAAATVPEMVEAIEAEGFGIDWQGAGAAEIEEAIRDAAARGEPVVVTDHECNYASADDLEAFLKANGLPFRKEWDAGGEYGPGIVVWDGQDEREYTSAGISHSDALLDRQTFNGLKTLEAVADWFTAAEYKPPAITITEP